MKQNSTRNSFQNAKDLFRNTVRIAKMLIVVMPSVVIGMIVLTVVIGVMPVFAMRALGKLIDEIIISVESHSMALVWPALFFVCRVNYCSNNYSEFARVFG